MSICRANKNYQGFGVPAYFVRSPTMAEDLEHGPENMSQSWMTMNRSTYSRTLSYPGTIEQYPW